MVANWLYQNPQFRELVIKLNQSQMSDGYDSMGKPLISDHAELGLPYTFSYAKLKREKGLSIGQRANLYLSGGLYNRMYLARRGASEFEILVEQTGFDLIEFWGKSVFNTDNILGLNPKNMQTLKEFSERLIYEKIRMELYK